MRPAPLLTAGAALWTESTVDVWPAALPNPSAWCFFPLSLFPSDNAWLVCGTDGHWELLLLGKANWPYFPSVLIVQYRKEQTHIES